MKKFLVITSPTAATFIRLDAAARKLERAAAEATEREAIARAAGLFVERAADAARTAEAEATAARTAADTAEALPASRKIVVAWEEEDADTATAAREALRAEARKARAEAREALRAAEEAEEDADTAEEAREALRAADAAEARAAEALRAVDTDAAEKARRERNADSMKARAAEALKRTGSTDSPDACRVTVLIDVTARDKRAPITAAVYIAAAAAKTADRGRGTKQTANLRKEAERFIARNLSHGGYIDSTADAYNTQWEEFVSIAYTEIIDTVKTERGKYTDNGILTVKAYAKAYKAINEYMKTMGMIKAERTPLLLSYDTSAEDGAEVSAALDIAESEFTAWEREEARAMTDAEADAETLKRAEDIRAAVDVAKHFMSTEEARTLEKLSDGKTLVTIAKEERKHLSTIIRRRARVASVLSVALEKTAPNTARIYGLTAAADAADADAAEATEKDAARTARKARAEALKRADNTDTEAETARTARTDAEKTAARADAAREAIDTAARLTAAADGISAEALRAAVDGLSVPQRRIFDAARTESTVRAIADAAGIRKSAAAETMDAARESIIRAVRAAYVPAVADAEATARTATEKARKAREKAARAAEARDAAEVRADAARDAADTAEARRQISTAAARVVVGRIAAEATARTADAEALRTAEALKQAERMTRTAAREALRAEADAADSPDSPEKAARAAEARDAAEAVRAIARAAADTEATAARAARAARAAFAHGYSPEAEAEAARLTRRTRKAKDAELDAEVTDAEARKLSGTADAKARDAAEALTRARDAADAEALRAADTLTDAARRAPFSEFVRAIAARIG